MRQRGLCQVEKDEVYAKGRSMKERSDDLYNGFIHVHLHYTNYGSDFDEARKQLAAVYTQLKSGQYFDITGLQEYEDGLKALAVGRTNMFNAFGRGEIGEVTYNDLFKKMEACEKACAAYATVWQKIRDFDRKNKTAAVQRGFGTYAFSKKKADITDMRALLRGWVTMDVA
jgi:hypothetical protein